MRHQYKGTCLPFMAFLFLGVAANEYEHSLTPAPRPHIESCTLRLSLRSKHQPLPTRCSLR